MKTKSRVTAVASLAVAMFIVGAVQAVGGTVFVGAFGDQGWLSDDTRTPNGVDLVGINYTHAGKPGQTPTAADDATIAQQIKFIGNAPAANGPYGTNALELTFGTGTGSGKATLSTINTGTGFATGDWSSGFFANFGLYCATYTNTTLKIGIQSPSWGTGVGQSQNGFTATRSGESSFDLILTYTGHGNLPSWDDIGLNSSTGTWTLHAQSGNTFFGTIPTANYTLAGWDSTSAGKDANGNYWSSDLFGSGAKVTNVQIGAGSFSVASTGYVDYLQTSLLNGGDQINFVPEPGTLVLLITAGLVALCYAWRRRRS